MEAENRGIDPALFKYLLKAIAGTGYYQLTGLRLQAIAPGMSEFIVDTGPQHCNPMGLIHGGIYTALADTVMGNAIRSLGKVVVTCSMSVNFVSSAPIGERILARGKVTRTGRTMFYASAEIFSGDKIVATAIGTFFHIRDIDLSAEA